MDQCGVQRPVRGEADLAIVPEASLVELWDPFQRVIAAGVGVAGEITDGPEGVEDRGPRVPL